MTTDTVPGLLIAALALAACSHVDEQASGRLQKVSITSAPKAANVALSNGQSCVTPCDVTAKAYVPLKVTFSKPGCLTQMQLAVPTLQTIQGRPAATAAYGRAAIYHLTPDPIVGELTCSEGGMELSEPIALSR